MTLLMLSSILVVALSVSDIVNIGLHINRNQVYSTKAYFAAEAGAEQVLSEIRSNGFDPRDDSSKNCDDGDYISFNNGDCGGSAPCCLATEQIYTLSTSTEYSVRYNNPDCCQIILTSRGRFTDVQRAIQATYCQPDCGAKECGTNNNGCGGDCGACGPNSVCDDPGTETCSCSGPFDDCNGTGSGGDLDGCETSIGTDTDCSGCGDDCTALGLSCIGGICQ